jgi:PAS domain S-box-containing protein
MNSKSRVYSWYGANMSSADTPLTDADSFRHIVEDLVEYAIFVIDLDGRIASWNSGARRIKGYSDAEAIGMPFAKLFTAEDVVAGRPQYEMSYALEHGVFHGEGKRVRKDGTVFEADVTLRRVSAPDGRACGFVKVTRDITDRKRIAELQESANQKLLATQREANEQLVIAGLRAQTLTETAEVARERAEASERQLRAVAEFREMFIGIVGHDLRNPLSGINMAAGLLLSHGRLDDRGTNLVARIVNGTQRMVKMITQLLDLTRARLGGGLPLEVKPTDMSAICQAVIDDFDPQLTRLQIEGDVTGVWDPVRLAEALSNIVGNATVYAEPGSVIVVKTYEEVDAVVVEIINQGAPIPADVLPFIFEPFRQAKPNDVSTAGNLGLGLYIAHQIALAHGGTLTARSSSGTTTFAMRLPRRLTPANARA